MDAIVEFLKPYGGWGVAGALVVVMFFLFARGEWVTKTMLTEIRANDRETIATQKDALTEALATLPEILKSVQGSEYALHEIQQAGKGARRD